MLQDENEKLKSQYGQIKNQYTMLEDHLQRISHQRNHLLQKIDEKECKIIDLNETIELRENYSINILLSFACWYVCLEEYSE